MLIGKYQFIFMRRHFFYRNKPEKIYRFLTGSTYMRQAVLKLIRELNVRELSFS